MRYIVSCYRESREQLHTSVHYLHTQVTPHTTRPMAASTTPEAASSTPMAASTTHMAADTDVKLTLDPPWTPPPTPTRAHHSHIAHEFHIVCTTVGDWRWGVALPCAGTSLGRSSSRALTSIASARSVVKHITHQAWLCVRPRPMKLELTQSIWQVSWGSQGSHEHSSVRGFL